MHWRFDSVAEMVDEYGTKFGPIVLLRSTLEPSAGWEALESDLTAVFEELTYAEDDGVAFDGDYLITQGTKPG